MYCATKTMTKAGTRLTSTVRNSRTRSRLGARRRSIIEVASPTGPSYSPEMIFWPSGLMTNATRALIAGFTLAGSAATVM